METPKNFYVNLTHDCGAKRSCDIADIEQPFTCKGCGVTEAMVRATIAFIYSKAGMALLEAARRRDETGEDTRVIWNGETDTIN